MIITGSEIVREWETGRIHIDPFEPSHVNPNSYNFTLGNRFLVYRDFPLDPKIQNPTDSLEAGPNGIVLEPRRLYLACTREALGSEHYAPTFAARSSVARLGVFINLSACLGDIGYIGHWTLQLYCLHPIRLYPGMAIGQMMWWKPQGEITLYRGKYQGSQGPVATRVHYDYMVKSLGPNGAADAENPAVMSSAAGAWCQSA